LQLQKIYQPTFQRKPYQPEREVRNFIKSGGSFKPISEVSSDLFFDMYDELYFARRNTHVSDVDLNRKFFKEFHHRFKGDVMMMGEDPVAIQILISADSQAGFFVDYINIGYKQEKMAHPWAQF
jgi:hypothetical protein